eukprot:jgi/Galph1/3745/GphlegSOOS_G2390.1
MGDYEQTFRLLSSIYHIQDPKKRCAEVLDTLIEVMLSQNTTDRNASKAFKNLKVAYKDWSQVLDAPVAELEGHIRISGLAKTKASRIQLLLRQIKQERSELSLEYLRGSSIKVVRKELSRFKGVGPKTIACVAAFSLGLSEFPVDTHVYRVCKRLGWIPEACSREQAYSVLNESIPCHLRLPLHLLLISHGRTLCRSRKPSCEECPLKTSCSYYEKTAISS